MTHSELSLSRRGFLGAGAAGLVAHGWSDAGRTRAACDDQGPAQKARIAITFDLEMSRHYPRRGMTEWDYQKGNLDQPTKDYAVEAARVVEDLGGKIHFFCVGRVLEQPNVDWLIEIAEAGHPVGNHTYDHVNLLAASPAQTQFRFQRAPWLIEGRTTSEILRENIRLTTAGLKERCGIDNVGFRTPGGFHSGLDGREDLQQMLLELGFTWVSSKYPAHESGDPMQEPSEAVYTDIVRAQAEAQPYVYPTGLIEVPMSPISDVGAFRTKFWKLEYFLKAVRLAVERAIETGGVFDFLCHPSCMVVEDPEFETVKLICRLVNEVADRAEIVGLDTIAESVSRV
jgi:peptidoglycan/xylan/chitin deacetylase (PgdA/CDA1 family)